MTSSSEKIVAQFVVNNKRKVTDWAAAAVTLKYSTWKAIISATSELNFWLEKGISLLLYMDFIYLTEFEGLKILFWQL